MRESMSQYPRPTLPKRRKPAPPAGTPEHQEWLVDEASEESFPASDPSAPATAGTEEAPKQVDRKNRKKK